MITIIHLSDTHFGYDYVGRSLLRMRRFWKTEDKQLIHSLQEAIRKIQPDYVIHTGDIVNKATKRNFAKAAAKLRSVLGNAGVDIKRRVLVIPGNHDVKIFAKEDKFWGRLAAFNGFLKAFFDEPDYRSRKPNFVIDDTERKIWFFCLDSTLKEKRGLAEGEVGVGQWDWFQNKLVNLTRLHPDHESFIKIVAIHHHPHAIRAGGQEQFMHLLDAGKAEEMFKACGVSLVLHGHKHYPHHKTITYEGDGLQHYTVIGAGTATCPFLEEQSGEGNSFNVLKIKPSANLFSLERWKAGTDKEYRPIPNPTTFPIFQASPDGYRIRQSIAINRIHDLNGACSVTHERRGIIVDTQGAELRTLVFGMGGTAQQAKLSSLDIDDEAISGVSFELNGERQKKGYFTLRSSLRQGSDPIDLWFTYEMTNGFCMRLADYKAYYPESELNEESVSMDIVHPCDQMTLVVEFPRKYLVKPRFRGIDRNRAEVKLEPPRASFSADPLGNRYTLVVRRPNLQNIYSIYWQVPESTSFMRADRFEATPHASS
jgi:calcineurin-like phosphoesterase family protein